MLCVWDTLSVPRGKPGVSHPSSETAMLPPSSRTYFKATIATTLWIAEDLEPQKNGVHIKIGATHQRGRDKAFSKLYLSTFQGFSGFLEE